MLPQTIKSYNETPADFASCYEFNNGSAIHLVEDCLFVCNVSKQRAF